MGQKYSNGKKCKQNAQNAQNALQAQVLPPALSSQASFRRQLAPNLGHTGQARQTGQTKNTKRN